MEQNKDWVKQHFTPEQLEQMQSLSEQSYSDEARERLAARGAEWTEADQERASAQWAEVNADIARLTGANADPAGDEAQGVAKRYSDLISGFTGGDPEIAKGLNTWWESFQALPDSQKPISSPYSKEQQVWLERACGVYRGSK